MSFLDEFFGQGEEIEIPLGGDFSRNTIAHWIVAQMFAFMYEGEITDSDFTCDIVRQTRTDWVNYYYHSREEAAEWNEEYGTYDNPTRHWLFGTPVNTILNITEEGRSSIQSPMLQKSCRIIVKPGDARSKSHHELHMISLVAAVRAYAEAAGWEVPQDNPLDLLLTDEIGIDDDIAAALIGGKPLADAGEVITVDKYSVTVSSNGKIPFTESILWKYGREPLWVALGADNVKAYQQSGKLAVPAGSKIAKALGVFTYPWSGPLWCRVTDYLDPRTDALSSAGNRLRIPAVTEMFATEAEAKKVAGAEMAERGATSDAQSGPSIPKDWQGYEDNWLDKVRELKKLYPGPLPSFRKQLEAIEADGLLYKEHACTAAEAVAWYGEV